MRQRMYRILLSIFATWITPSIASLLAAASLAQKPGNPASIAGILLLIGFVPLPVSVIGLWNLRRWGFVTLLIASTIVIAVDPPNVILHALCVVITIVRYLSANHETGPELPTAGVSHRNADWVEMDPKFRGRNQSEQRHKRLSIL